MRDIFLAGLCLGGVAGLMAGLGIMAVTLAFGERRRQSD